MSKRSLEQKRQAREERTARKEAADAQRRNLNVLADRCYCGTPLEPHIITVVATGKKVAVDLCPRCYDNAA